MNDQLSAIKIFELYKYEDELPGYMDSEYDGVNTRSNTGDSLLITASIRNNYEEVYALLTEGADPNQQGEMNYTAAHYASKYKNNDMLKLLKEYGADMLIKNDFGKTP